MPSDSIARFARCRRDRSQTFRRCPDTSAPLREPIRRNPVARASGRTAPSEISRPRSGRRRSHVPALSQGLSHARNREDRPNTDQRIAGTENDPRSAFNRFEHARGRPRSFDSFERNCTNGRLGAPLNQIFLKVKTALVGLNHGRHRLIAHGENSRLHPQRFPDGIRSLRKTRSGPEHGRAMNVRGQIPISEMEPLGAA